MKKEKILQFAPSFQLASRHDKKGRKIAAEKPWYSSMPVFRLVTPPLPKPDWFDITYIHPTQPPLSLRSTYNVHGVTGGIVDSVEVNLLVIVEIVVVEEVVVGDAVIGLWRDIQRW